MARVVFGVALLLSGIALAGQTPFIDEFEGDSFDPRWEWRRPLAGPERFLEDGTFVLTMTKAKFDAWDTVDNAPRLRTLDDQFTAPSSGSCTTVVRWSSLVMTSRNSFGVIWKRDLMGALCSSATSFNWHSASLASPQSPRTWRCT